MGPAPRSLDLLSGPWSGRWRQIFRFWPGTGPDPGEALEAARDLGGDLEAVSDRAGRLT